MNHGCNQGCALVLLGVLAVVLFPLGTVVCLPLMVLVAFMGSHRNGPDVVVIRDTKGKGDEVAEVVE